MSIKANQYETVSLIFKSKEEDQSKPMGNASNTSAQTAGQLFVLTTIAKIIFGEISKQSTTFKDEIDSSVDKLTAKSMSPSDIPTAQELHASFIFGSANYAIHNLSFSNIASNLKQLFSSIGNVSKQRLQQSLQENMPGNWLFGLNIITLASISTLLVYANREKINHFTQNGVNSDVYSEEFAENESAPDTSDIEILTAEKTSEMSDAEAYELVSLDSDALHSGIAYDNEIAVTTSDGLGFTGIPASANFNGSSSGGGSLFDPSTIRPITSNAPLYDNQFVMTFESFKAITQGEDFNEPVYSIFTYDPDEGIVINSEVPTISYHTFITAYSSGTPNIPYDSSMNMYQYFGHYGSVLPFVITDADSSQLTGALIKFMDGTNPYLFQETTYNPLYDTLTFDNNNAWGITGTFNAGTGELLLSGAASISDYEAAIRSVDYFNSDFQADMTMRTITVQVTDGDFLSNEWLLYNLMMPNINGTNAPYLTDLSYTDAPYATITTGDSLHIDLYWGILFQTLDADYDTDFTTLIVDPDNQWVGDSAAGGTITIESGVFIYTPPEGYTGVDTIEIAAIDQAGHVSNTATLHIATTDVSVTETDVDVTFEDADYIESGNISDGQYHDLVVADVGANELVLMHGYNESKNSWQTTTIAENVEDITSIAVADATGDDEVDVLYSSGEDNTLVLLENSQGDGSQWTTTIVDNNFTANSMAVGDTDGNGVINIVATSEVTNEIAVWEHDGNEWQKTEVVSDYEGLEDVHIADVDADGTQDILSTSSENGVSLWRWNDQTNAYDETNISSKSNYLKSISVDFDSDGNNDVVSMSRTGITLFENQDGNAGDWSSGETILDHYSNFIRDIGAYDIDDDGDLDLIAVLDNYLTSGKSVAWIENNGSQWIAHGADKDFSMIDDAVIADINGDQSIEIIAVNDETAKMWELE